VQLGLINRGTDRCRRQGSKPWAPTINQRRKEVAMRAHPALVLYATSGP